MIGKMVVILLICGGMAAFFAKLFSDDAKACETCRYFLREKCGGKYHTKVCEKEYDDWRQSALKGGGGWNPRHASS